MILAQGKLILEEVLELFEACGLVVVPSGTPDAAISSNAVRRGSVELKLDPGAEPLDLPHIAKEIADVSVVNTGMFVEFGMSDLALLEEVDMNNLAKFGPGGFLGPDRKWQKPPKHPKPDLASVLKLQGWEQPETSRETHTTNTSVSG
jgi:predicted HAD superfamily Cof-like phosphohydrolase